jgi:hypothetical protein
MPVIPVNKVMDKKRILGKTEGQGGGKAQGVADKKMVFGTFGVFPQQPWLHFSMRFF